ncbi:MAG: DUF4842 domain-containing protein [Bacteroidales bacterium]|nr:DUF4842 domain-containing protein [Candidatus Minthousia equi]
MGKKLLWKVLPVAFLAGVGSTAFTSCADEYDPAKITREDILKENYAKNWEEVFGTPDPNQDWSMAQLVIANVDLGGNTNGVVKIYSGAPNALGTTLLAEEILSEGKATFTFDALKGAKFVCARIECGNSVVKSGVYDIVNGQISIGKAATRANTDDPCTVTKTAFDYNASRLKPVTVAALQNSSYDNYQDLVDNDPNAGDYSKAIDMALITENVPNLYVLNDVDFTRHDDGYTYTELRPIFADYINKNAETVGGAFKEGVDHIAQYVSYGEMETNVTFQVKEDGPVEMDCIWRGTQLNDFFGYYYYTGNEPTAEELWNIKKYILIGNSVTGSSTNWIKDTSSLTQKKESGSADWVDLDGMGIPLRYNSPNPASDDVNKLRGTILRLVYFGADGNGSASYNFPAGTKIGFFMVDTNNTAKFFYSQSRENYQLERRLYTPAGTPNSSWLAQQTANKNQHGAVEGPNARPFAASFSYDGRVYLGFGDESGDCDMNDLVFITSNVVPPSNDITPGDLSKAESVSWLVACEDLGGTYDYDFNDLVFEINREKAKSTDETYSLYLTPMAAGGTLPAMVYYNNELVGEIHSLLGGTNTSSIINATYGQTPRIGSKILLSSSLAEADKDIATILGKIKVVVSQSAGDTNSQVVIEAYRKDETATNSAPQLILLPGGWDWPSENTPITSVYPNFVQWTSDVTYTT